MNEIAQIRKLSLWIFFIPFIAINICLIISQNYHLLENSFFKVDMIGRSGFSIPYLDGSLSISRASRTFPQYLIFKPLMILTSVLVYFYWVNNNRLVNKYRFTNLNYKFKPKILTIYTGPLDALMKFKFGKLEWRSLVFKKKSNKQKTFKVHQ